MPNGCAPKPLALPHNACMRSVRMAKLAAWMGVYPTHPNVCSPGLSVCSWAHTSAGDACSSCWFKQP